MRSLVLGILGSALLSSVAFADDAAAPAPAPAPAAGALPAIDPSVVPPQCQTLAAIPGDATVAAPSVEAYIATAGCGAEAKFEAIKGSLTPDDAGVAAMTDAAKPYFGLLDAAIKAGDPTWTPVAQKARMDLVASMIVRMRNSIPPITMQTVGPALADHDAKHAALEPKIQPWIDMLAGK